MTGTTAPMFTAIVDRSRDANLDAVIVAWIAQRDIAADNRFSPPQGE